MRALVTGAAGFIGSNLVDRLLADGHSVVGIDNLSTGNRGNLTEALAQNRCRTNQFTLVKNDIQNCNLTDLVSGSDVVFHLAAHVDLRASVAEPQHDARSNVLGTINVLEACRKADVPRIVYAASGGSRYGAPDVLPVAETARLAPMSPYAAAKAAGELYLEAYSAMYGIAPIALGLANVYGPRQDPHGEAGVVAIFTNAMTIDRPTTIFGDGSAARDYVYVSDVVDAFVRAAAAPMRVTGLYNVGTGQQTTVNQLHALIADATGSTCVPSYAPARPGEVPAIALDAGKARRELGWTPAVPIADGVKRTVEWLHDKIPPSETLMSPLPSFFF